MVLKPGEEVKGVMLDVEYFPIQSSAEGHPALQVSSMFHLRCICVFTPSPVSTLQWSSTLQRSTPMHSLHAQLRHW